MRRRPIRTVEIAAVVITTVFLACDSTPAEVTGPGELQALLISPNGAEGAAVIELAGEGIGAVTAFPGSGRVFAERVGSTVRVVVVLDQPGEIRFRVAVDDVSDPPTGAVLEIADGSNEMRQSLAGYSVEFAR